MGMINTPGELTEERYLRHGYNLFEFAKKLGWKDDGEGPLEYVQRISYAQGLEDAKNDYSDND